MVYFIPNFKVLHFLETLIKIQSKKSKLQLHKNLHKNVNAIFHEFMVGQLKQQICYSFTLLISYMDFNPFKMAVQF